MVLIGYTENQPLDLDGSVSRRGDRSGVRLGYELERVHIYDNLTKHNRHV